MFLHDEFLAAASREGLVKTPIELVVGAARSLGVTIGARHVSALVALEQVPFLPPDVAGWPANEGWLSTASALARLPARRRSRRVRRHRALDGLRPADRDLALAQRLGVPFWGRRTATALAATTDPTAALTLALAAPEHVLA